MRFHWLRARVFVHATEDEPRVHRALLAAMAQTDVPRAGDRITRSRTKGHYGNEILVLEGTLKRGADIEAALRGLLAHTQLRTLLRETLLRRLDPDGVLHVRLDKQAAVGGVWSTTEGSDAIVVTVKAQVHPGQTLAQLWARFLDQGLSTEDPAPEAS
jgi:RNA binding exosome subunit